MNRKIRKEFWKLYQLSELTHEEWELLCDGCGKCCLLKLDNEYDEHVAYTKLACRLFDNKSCKCKNYKMRGELVKDCIVLTKETIEKHFSWMPKTCAYRLIQEGKDLESWHHLISGSPNTIHNAGLSVKGKTVSELDVPEVYWSDNIIPNMN